MHSSVDLCFFAYNSIRLVTYKKTRTYLKVHFDYLQLFKCEQELLKMSGVANNAEKGQKRKKKRWIVESEYK